MSEDVDSVVLEHLRHIRRKVDSLSDDMFDVKERLSQVEIGQGQLLTHIGQLNMRMDRMDKRIERIESRLDLSEAPNPAAE